MQKVLNRIVEIKEQKEAEYREYAEVQFLRRHLKDRIAYLMGREAPKEMIDRAQMDYAQLAEKESRQCYQH